MPFKSEAQRERARKQVERGEITQAKFDEWNEGTPKKIPERIHVKKAECCHVAILDVANRLRRGMDGHEHHAKELEEAVKHCPSCTK